VSVLREIGQEVAIIRCARKSEKGQEGKEGLGLTYAADFVRRRCRCVGLRRGIPPAWRRLVQENEREMWEECWGFL
jgi:hypothetical protein